MKDFTSLYHTKLQANEQKYMCKNAQSTNAKKDWSPAWLYSDSSFEHTCKQQLWHNFKQKNIAEVLHILKFLPLPFQ